MIIEARDIHKSFRSPAGRLDVLRGVSLSLKAGEISCIMGRSGSGKSTLLHILGMLDRCDKGTLFIDGKDVSRLSDDKKCEIRNSRIGFVFQFYNLLPELTVLENVMLPAIIGNRKRAKTRAKELLEQVALTERIGHFPFQLSGGEQQRVALVRALMNEPAVVFCDEPTGNLDEENSAMVLSLIEKLHHENRQTFCIVTHDSSLVKSGVTAYVLKSGQLV